MKTLEKSYTPSAFSDTFNVKIDRVMLNNYMQTAPSAKNPDVEVEVVFRKENGITIGVPAWLARAAYNYLSDAKEVAYSQNGFEFVPYNSVIPSQLPCFGGGL